MKNDLNIIDLSKYIKPTNRGHFPKNAPLPNKTIMKRLFGKGTVALQEIILPVDYSKTIEQMVESGKYDWACEFFTSQHFSIIGKGVINYQFLCLTFNRNVSSEEIYDLIKEEEAKNPWRPAKIEHLLTFGEHLPDEQRMFSILAVGGVTRIQGVEYIANLHGDEKIRTLNLRLKEGGFISGTHFLVVRKAAS